MKISYIDGSKFVPIGAEGYQKGQKQAVTYTDKVDTYKELTYDEDERLKNPVAYSCNGEGERTDQRINLEGEQAKQFMVQFGLEKWYREGNNVDLLILWRLPRKEYNETDMWVYMSGYSYSLDPFNPNHFVISDGRVIKEAQQKALDIIDTLNEWVGG